MSHVYTGLEQLLKETPKWLNGQRLGLLANPASVDRHFRHSRFLINEKFPGRIKALFSPQHGFFAEKQDNMIESDHITDPSTGIQVYSLYGETRKPTASMLEDIDTLIIDIQDVGTRVYTFIYTMSYCMEAAAESGKKIVVLDRPNPIGGEATEGNILSESVTSFVGRFPIPMRHGLTIGEVALLFNSHFGIDCDLTVIPMSGWRRHMYFDDTDLPWIAPSPNLPTVSSAVVYPGQVIFEGTNISEGRGTTQPFELFGAPYMEPDRLLEHLPAEATEGIHLRHHSFEPTSNKWSGTVCNGFQLHITDLKRYAPYKSSLAFLQSIIKTSADQFLWKKPPYEYEYHKLPIDLIIGDQTIREQIESGVDISMIEASWLDELNRFNSLKQKFHLYT